MKNIIIALAIGVLVSGCGTSPDIKPATSKGCIRIDATKLVDTDTNGKVTTSTAKVGSGWGIIVNMDKGLSYAVGSYKERLCKVLSSAVVCEEVTDNGLNVRSVINVGDGYSGEGWKEFVSKGGFMATQEFTSAKRYKVACP